METTNKKVIFGVNLKLKTMESEKQLTVIAPVGASKESDYLTDLKEYEVLSSDDEIFFILADNGVKIACRFDFCAHLPSGLKWKLK